MMMKQMMESRLMFWSLVVSAVVFLFLTILGIYRHDYWSYIIYEKSPMGYYEALLLLISFVLCLLNLRTLYKIDKKIRVSWAILSLGFFYLLLDERLEIHETVREEILKPLNVKIDILFWVEKGDYVLIFILCLGLMLLPLVLKELIKFRKATQHFLIALTFSTVAIFIDSIDLRGIYIEEQKLIQYFEEVFETLGMVFFMNSFSDALRCNRQEYSKAQNTPPHFPND